MADILRIHNDARRSTQGRRLISRSSIPLETCCLCLESANITTPKATFPLFKYDKVDLRNSSGIFSAQVGENYLMGRKFQKLHRWMRWGDMEFPIQISFWNVRPALPAYQKSLPFASRRGNLRETCFKIYTYGKATRCASVTTKNERY